jgi:DNA repair exonuclease SbcCD ATPase subunit
MKIKGTCGRCVREFLAQQVIESGGHCPWCGQPFNRDYTANLAQALQEAEVAANRLQDALQQIAGMELAMELDDEAIVEPIRTELRAARRRRSKV